MPESEWQRQVLAVATLRGWAAVHFYDSRRSLSKGWPDLVLARPPRLLFVELKREAGRVTREQAAWLEILARCGSEVYVWRPSDWPQVEEVLQ